MVPPEGSTVIVYSPHRTSVSSRQPRQPIHSQFSRDSQENNTTSTLVLKCKVLLVLKVTSKVTNSSSPSEVSSRRYSTQINISNKACKLLNLDIALVLLRTIPMQVLLVNSPTKTLETVSVKQVPMVGFHLQPKVDLVQAARQVSNLNRVI